MSHEKTPMQQLLEKLEYAKTKLLHAYPQEEAYDEGFMQCLVNVCNDVKAMLPIEKQCISDAFSDGEQNHVLLINSLKTGRFNTSEEYYKNKFNN